MGYELMGQAADQPICYQNPSSLGGHIGQIKSRDHFGTKVWYITGWNEKSFFEPRKADLLAGLRDYGFKRVKCPKK